MTTAAKPVPDGYHSITPYLIVSDAAKAIEFYQQAFGAVELYRMASPNGQIGHAEIKIGDSPIMLADEMVEMGFRGPQSLGGTPVSIMLYVEDVDVVAAQAVSAGATLQRAVMDQFYGDRSGSVTDPFGHQWHISTHKEDLTAEELQTRFEEYMKKHANAA